MTDMSTQSRTEATIRYYLDAMFDEISDYSVDEESDEIVILALEKVHLDQEWMAWNEG